MTECHSLGLEYYLPTLDDIDLVMVAMNQKGWKSVWSGIKRFVFDDFYWEDGSKLQPEELNGNNGFPYNNKCIIRVQIL